MCYKFPVLFLALIAFTLGSECLAQTNADLPYTRFGIGDVIDQDFNAVRSMGGISSAFSDEYLTNISNPASLAGLTAASFEIGFDASRTGLSRGDQSSSIWTGNLNYFSIAFPLINSLNRQYDRRSDDFSWGMSLSLTPNSRVKYFTTVEGEQPNVGGVVRQYQGSGGTNRFTFGNGFKYKQWYAGINLGYMFGAIKKERAVLFPDIPLASRIYELQDASYRGFFYNIGVQYELDLSGGAGAEDIRDRRSITFGLNGNSNWSFNTVSNSMLALKDFTYEGLTDQFPDEETDTLYYTEDVRLGGTMPAELALGAVYKQGTRWVLGVNFRTTAWSNYKNELGIDQINESQVNNAFEVGLGGQFWPDRNSLQSYFDRMIYRGGLRFGTDPRVIDGQQIQRFAVDLGVGLPVILSRQLSFINFGIEYGRYGGDIPVQQDYFRFSLGVTLNNNLWFYKRKFN